MFPIKNEERWNQCNKHWLELEATKDVVRLREYIVVGVSMFYVAGRIFRACKARHDEPHKNADFKLFLSSNGVQMSTKILQLQNCRVTRISYVSSYG